eukprot:CAMPEP_0115840642 /NCGR_PEP_ID=MMETSP0287-20121206/6877_1 /TAXON_ID=412157 /ORGANISM="Chrysochromulina rotalis, Strain UIO044" /LENGTH=402 /DNA_ID=CAMNT_0003294261 /DNA_START=20 /DNA_END=1228 /DNA_ORIENTATION=-
MPSLHEAGIDIILERMRRTLKQRGAEGIKGLARNFRICDTGGSEMLNVEELGKCCNLCRLGLKPDEVNVLHSHVDVTGDGFVTFNEFVRAVRGRLSDQRRKLVVKCFEQLDRAGDGNGELSVADIRPFFSIENDPRFLTGEKTEGELLQEFLQGIEGSSGDRNGIIGLDEWVNYYEEISSSMDDDDAFGLMMTSSWSALKARGPYGEEMPAIEYVCEGDIDVLEKILRQNVFQKSAGTNEERALKAAFKAFDVDNSGEVDFHEFTRAMERFGLAVAQPGQKGSGGVPPAALRGLFNRYNADGSSCISYLEFSDGLFSSTSTAASSDPGNGANPMLPALVRDYADTASRPTQASRPGSAVRVRSIANQAERPPDPCSGHRIRSIANQSRRELPPPQRSSGIFG